MPELLLATTLLGLLPAELPLTAMRQSHVAWDERREARCVPWLHTGLLRLHRGPRARVCVYRRHRAIRS